MRVAVGLRNTQLPVEPLIRDLELSYAGPMTDELTQSQRTALLSAPTKMSARLERLFRDGFDRLARMKLARGENPFGTQGAKHLHLAGEMLLAGGFTRTEFRERCMSKFGWTFATASSESSQAVSLLRLLGIANEISGKLQVAAKT